MSAFSSRSLPKSLLFIRLFWMFAVLGIFPQHGFGQPGTPQPTLRKVTLLIGQQHFSAEIARSLDELSTGLMFRKTMGDNEGMLFCLTSEGPANFWMQNTLLPLSVAYLDRSGKILEIHDMKPLDETTVSSTSDKVYYALETNQGWFTLNKISPGVVIKPEGTTLDLIRQQKPIP